MILCQAAAYAGIRLGAPVLVFYLFYAVSAVAVLALERFMPHEPAWLENDGQTSASILHTLLSTAVAQGVIGFGATASVAAAIQATGAGGIIWPRHWSLAAQLLLGLIVSEFGMYWAHRLAHEWKALWVFHAVHHGVERLWIVNSGRFHFVDAVKSIIPGVGILAIIGAPTEVLTWLAASGATLGMLTHSNADMRCGPLSLVFNTPELHRWHHSRLLVEGNSNYGENIMLWDLVFGTWFHADRRPPRDIGIAEPMPTSFWRQVVWPFARLWGPRPAPGIPRAS
jgi:sterol desaturase/sphingolipid hydroxylase (fatty acid hydroxylase superfamily)